MPVEKDPKLGLYIDAFKAWLPTLRMRLAAWFDACRAEPVLIWQTPAVRYATYLTGGLIAAWVLSSVLSWTAPPDAPETATTADFHVVCTNPTCGHHFVINRKFGFRKFPVTCPRCQQPTGERAVRCAGGPRDGEWVRATETEKGVWIGAECSASPAQSEDPAQSSDR
jgi:hypothetical protein